MAEAKKVEHVLLLTTSYKSCFNDQSSPFFRDQAIALKKAGLKVGVLCPLPISLKQIWKTKKIKFSQEIYLDQGVETMVYPFLSLPKMRGLTVKKRLLIGKSIFKKYVEEHGLPDIIHVHTFLAGELAIWVKEQFQVPYVVTEHSSAFQRGLLNRLQLDIAQEVFSKSKSNIAVSKSLANILSKYFSIPFFVIPNIVDVAFFQPKKSEKSLYTFINVAHLNKNKNHAMMIRAFEKHYQVFPNSRLLILGGGEEKANLQALVSRLDLTESVRFFGYANREEVRAALQNSDCFVLTSKVETFGVVLIEAMACGIPVVSTRSGGPESIIVNSDLGILCENNSEAISKAMSFVSNQQYSSTKIRNYVVENFSEDVAIKKIIELYKTYNF